MMFVRKHGCGGYVLRPQGVSNVGANGTPHGLGTVARGGVSLWGIDIKGVARSLRDWQRSKASKALPLAFRVGARQIDGAL